MHIQPTTGCTSLVRSSPEAHCGPKWGRAHRSWISKLIIKWTPREFDLFWKKIYTWWKKLSRKSKGKKRTRCELLCRSKEWSKAKESSFVCVCRHDWLAEWQLVAASRSDRGHHTTVTARNYLRHSFFILQLLYCKNQQYPTVPAGLSLWPPLLQFCIGRLDVMARCWMNGWMIARNGVWKEASGSCSCWASSVIRYALYWIHGDKNISILAIEQAIANPILSILFPTHEMRFQTSKTIPPIKHPWMVFPRSWHKTGTYKPR